MLKSRTENKAVRGREARQREKGNTFRSGCNKSLKGSIVR